MTICKNTCTYKAENTAEIICTVINISVHAI